MSILLKPVYRFKAIPIKITIGFLTEIDKINFFKFVKKWKGHGIAKSILENKNNFGGLTLSDCKNYKAIVNMTV